MSFYTDKKQVSETSLARMAKTLQDKGVLVNRNNVRKNKSNTKTGNLNMVIGDPIVTMTKMPSTPRSFAYSPMARPGDKVQIIIGGWDNPKLKELEKDNLHKAVDIINKHEK